MEYRAIMKNKPEEELTHFKYVDKYKAKNGKWVYVYNRKGVDYGFGTTAVNRQGVNDTKYIGDAQHESVDGKRIREYVTSVDLEDNTKFTSQLNKDLQIDMKRRNDKAEGYVNKYVDFNSNKKISELTINSHAVINRAKNFLKKLFDKN